VVRGTGADVTFAATQPLTVVMGQRTEELDDAELRFFVGRALEQARAGTLAVRACRSTICADSCAG